ncbi:MAG: hypothetical protein AAF742_00805 [Pseudomonadota bacterium]
MATNDERWRDQLDTSANGVFRSAWAVFYSIPFSLTISFITWKSMDLAGDTQKHPFFYAGKMGFIGIQTSELLITWLAKIAALTFIARNLGAEGRITRILVGFNWAQPVFIVILTMASGVWAISPSSNLGHTVSLSVLAIQVMILWGVFRRGFESDAATTVAILGGILVVDILVTSAIRRLAIGLLEMTGSL